MKNIKENIICAGYALVMLGSVYILWVLTYAVMG